MSEKPETVYMVLHESVLVSWAKDVVSVATLLGLAYANHIWIGGSVALDVLACLGVGSMGFAQIGGGHRRILRRDLVTWAQREAAKGGAA